MRAKESQWPRWRRTSRNKRVYSKQQLLSHTNIGVRRSGWRNCYIPQGR